MGLTKAEKEAKKLAEQAAAAQGQANNQQPPDNNPPGDIANDGTPPPGVIQTTKPESTIDQVIDDIVERDERGVPYNIPCSATGGRCVPVYQITNLDGSKRYACAQCSGSGSDRLDIVKL